MCACMGVSRCVCMGVFVNVCGHLSKLNSTAVKQGQRYKGVKLVRIALLRIPFPPALRYHQQEGGEGVL